MRLREGSGGAGKHRGGFGLAYEVELLRGEARASFVMDHGRFGPQGALGGNDGAVNTVTVFRDGEAHVPPHLSKEQDIPLQAGDRVRVGTPGGGGYGDPLERDPARSRRWQRRRELGVLSRPAATAGRSERVRRRIVRQLTLTARLAAHSPVRSSEPGSSCDDRTPHCRRGPLMMSSAVSIWQSPRLLSRSVSHLEHVYAFRDIAPRPS